eukprot:1019408-Alexandrium_andersonii.AAC.1
MPLAERGSDESSQAAPALRSVAGSLLACCCCAGAAWWCWRARPARGSGDGGAVKARAFCKLARSPARHLRLEVSCRATAW